MRTAAKRAVGGLALAGGVVLLRPGTRANKLVCREFHEADRRLRYFGGRLRGASYRLRGRHPDPEVIDNVLADRIRSSLGTLEKRLDLPHIHVMVDDHVVLLHGEVASDADVDELMQAVTAVSGVVGVESYLHVGLIGGDNRPSAGRAVQQPSDAMKRLLAAAGSDAEPDLSRRILRAILATFADRLPAGERGQLAAHFPADVRVLFTPPRRTRSEVPPRTVHELVARIAAAPGELPRAKVEQITASVLSTLRSLVPEEAGDVSAVLPPELRDLWEGQVTE
jgi:uncharacterized protein (DUF2267 family)